MSVDVYFSHSWAPEHVRLNTLVWEMIGENCVLSVDREGASEGTYYVNRLEELIRKSDVFVAVLPYREGTAQSETASPEYRLSCSPWALFELRLAERARKPRWVVFDDRTLLSSMASANDRVLYTPIDVGEELRREGRNIRRDGARWLAAIQELARSDGTRSRNAAVLTDGVGEQRAVEQAIERALKRAGYQRVTKIDPSHTDSEVVDILQSCGLLVAEIGATSLREIYGMAHAMFIPSIRFVMADDIGNSLPRLLDGHPGGYHHDVITTTDAAALGSEIEKRANAMRDSRDPIKGIEAGGAYFRHKLYRKHQVFISHNLPAGDADFLQAVFGKLRSYGIAAWEYRNANLAGVDWRVEMQAALNSATDLVLVMAEGFETSQACTQELLSFAADPGKCEKVVPYLWGDRVKPTPLFSRFHHQTLPQDKAAAVNVLVARLADHLKVTK